MASCGNCGKEVGCACNLISGACVTCFSKAQADGTTLTTTNSKSSKRVRYSKEVSSDAGTEFEQILRTAGLTKEEKLKRINDILEKARLAL